MWTESYYLLNCGVSFLQMTDILQYLRQNNVTPNQSDLQLFSPAEEQRLHAAITNAIHACNA